MTRKTSRKRFTIWLMVGMTMIMAFGFFASNLAVNRVDDQYGARETQAVKLASQSFREALSLPAAQLFSVAELETEVRQSLNGDAQAMSKVTNAFVTLLLRNPRHAQARWIDETGREIVRVDQPDPGTVKIIGKSALQDKRIRPYVQQGLNLERNQLYVSQLDLNIENGAIQVPYMPVIRMAMRVYDDADVPKGLFVLNIAVASMLERVGDFSVNRNIVVLNNEGYWLKGPVVEDEWGFMFGKTTTMGTRSPEAWQKINASASGSAETADGLWTWETIEVAEPHLSVASSPKLKLASHIPVAVLTAARWRAVAPILLVIGLLALLYLAALSRLMREMEERHHAEQQAMLANKAKGAFLATMSHEIRTPMAGILGLTDMLMADNLPDESKGKLERIKSSAHALLRILNDILDFSKLDAGKFEIEKTPFSPADLANEVVQLFYQTCPPEKKDLLQITAKITSTFPEAVNADPTRLRQVLVNLMGNAVKFSDRGSVTLVCDHNAHQRLLEFEVIDTGIGMDDTMMDRLFQEFEQADASIGRKYHGTGLGLAICKRLVGLMGGEIRVRSTPGMGSAFWFSVPYDPASKSDLLTNHHASIQPTSEVQPLSVLVAEDNEINQMIIQNMLRKMGHQVTMAESGREALRLVEEHPDFDLILMDVRMPEMSGPDATRRIRQLPGKAATLPIIALTADVMEENRASYLEAGMNDCVGKPISHTELAAAINKATSALEN